MPIEGVDTFSCLCVPDLECAISGAADNNVVSHLGWPHAPCVAHQRAQTLKRSQKKKKSLDQYIPYCYCRLWMSEKLVSKTFRVISFIYITFEFRNSPLSPPIAFRGEKKTSKMNFLWPFSGKRSSVIPYLLLLHWDKISPWAFIIAFTYLSEKRAIHPLCRVGWQLSSIKKCAHSSSLGMVD